MALVQLELARCLDKGVGVAKDFSQVAVWYRKAAEQGNADAQCSLAGCFWNGEGVARDAAQAVVWYRKAAEQGNVAAQCSLASCLKNGVGVARDAAQAVVWYRKAAEQGLVEAQCILGTCLDNGDGVAQDTAEALVWFRKAAEQGNAEAQFILGLLQCVTGVPQDVKAGALSLGAAAQQGMPHALAALAERAVDRVVAKACCVGCGATTNLQACAGCHVARFCGKACFVRMWSVHKPHCRRWKAEAQAAAESSA